MKPDLEPFVSVIVPAYNAENFLGEAIESILAQTYQSYEIIVVDDGSKDRTREIVSLYPSVIYVYQTNAGTAAARNRGVEVARGEYLSFLDADDLWMPDKLQLQMAAFLADKNLEVVSGYVEQFVEPGQTQKYNYYPKPIPGYSSIAILIKQNVFKEIGLFHEDLLYAEIVSWFADLIDRKQKIMMLPDVVARRRIHGENSGLKDPIEKNREIIRILKNSIDRKRAE